MDLPYGSEYSHAFVTNVGMITTTGPAGPDIMSAEWTHHVSYRPGLIAICIKPDHATHDNILATKEFGVNIAASDQNVFAHVAGGSSGKDVDKIAVLKELGLQFFQAQQIKTLMVEGVVLSAECRLFKQIDHGDHTMFIGEVLEAKVNSEKIPLIYHKGKFWRFGESIPKPPQEELDRISKIVEKHRRK